MYDEPSLFHSSSFGEARPAASVRSDFECQPGFVDRLEQLPSPECANLEFASPRYRCLDETSSSVGVGDLDHGFKRLRWNPYRFASKL
jgi:hypothetical protein